MLSFFRKLKWLRRRPDKEAELREELEFHLEEEAGELRERGVGSEATGRTARRELGNLTLVQEETRATWTWTWWEQLGQDLRYALRTMGANKSFSALAILSLGLGIGANTAIFSFLDSILLRALPVRDPQQLVMLGWHAPRFSFHGTSLHDESYTDVKGGYVGGIFAYPAFELLQRGNAVFASVFGYQGAGDLNLTVHGQADQARVEYVSGGYFEGLGTQPMAGRLIGPDDDRAGAAPTAVISHAFSERRFGGAATATGQTILINNLPFTVVGVTAAQFFGADPEVQPEVYLPMHATLLLITDSHYPAAGLFADPEFDWVTIMARLRPGVTAEQAQASLAGPFYAWGRAAKPKMRPEEIPTLVVREGGGGLDSLRRRYSKPLYILLALVGLILAIACANIANLLLARAAARKREMAVRMSMGAGRMRVIRQLLTESVLLAALGGALGTGLAVWGIRFLTLLLANGRENFTLHAELNWRVLGMAAAVTLLTGMLFGLAPALESTRLDLIGALKGSRTGERRRDGSTGLGRVLMVSQIVLTFLIVVAAGLFARTLSNLAAIELGFNADNVLTFELNARQAGHPGATIVDFYNDLQRQFSAIPGVRSVSMSQQTLMGTGTSATGVGVPGGGMKGSRILEVGSGFFQTMEIPILWGRGIEERDRHGSQLVAVINEAFAKRNFGERNPLGQHLSLPLRCPKCDLEVVGVSANPLYGDLKKNPEPIVYLPFAQEAGGPANRMFFELRTAGDPLHYGAAVREIVHRADSRLPVSELKTQRAWIDETINQEITFARLCGAFALLALGIACVGLYGTMSYTVARRTGEIGIRVALGAPRRRVVWMVLREVCILAGVSFAIGLPTAMAVSKVVKSFLFGMHPNDPAALAGAVATLLIASMLAGYVPAHRASRIDPMTALRHE